MAKYRIRAIKNEITGEERFVIDKRICFIWFTIYPIWSEHGFESLEHCERELEQIKINNGWK